LVKISEIARSAKWIRESTSILIGAGAGLSADAGNNYTDTKYFATHFPALVKKGFTMKLQLMGYEDWTESQKWGYYGQYMTEIMNMPPHPVYGRLLDIVQSRDYFVLTTNVDELFVKNRFDPLRIYTPQGSYYRIQCVKPCSDETWPSRPIAERLYPLINHDTQEITDPAALPACPKCGGRVFINVRIGDWFVHAPYEEEQNRYLAWVANHQEQNLVLIEIGSGYHTPVWIRWPFERIVRSSPNARLIRINLEYPEIPPEIKHRAISIRGTAMETVNALWELLAPA
jgi:NAD-dependent SIR2 family protein deacetylase